ncbi:MAG: TerB family tellurite resistance protein [Cyclobacteriaceae bacterium]|nr:TerB family tellurite resistance protein [Cyclobacteriaceae bacterium]
MNFSDVLNLFRQGKGSARSHMKNLIEMAAADGNFADVEYSLLKSIAKRNNISESQLKEIRNNPGSVHFEVPADKTERFNQLYELVHMMTIDTSVHEEERKLSNLFAIKFGYPKNKVDELINVIQMNIKNNQPPNETMKRVEMLMA